MMEFTRMFPDDAACLDQLWRDRHLGVVLRIVERCWRTCYLQSYLDEDAWRHNAKREQGALFSQLLDRAAEGKDADA
jgi:hypothetical protein